MNIDKASLGTRYLIKYIKSKNKANLDVVKDCTKDIAFWALLMHFCNNMNDLFEDLPEPILKRIFTGEKIEKVVDILDDASAVEYSYGIGYSSDATSDYKTQLRLIRNALAHGSFTFDGKKINVYNPKSKFTATFDYEWFKSLVLSTLSNANFQIKRGIKSYSIIKLFNTSDKNASDIKALESKGLIKLIKLTCTASDASVISTKFPRLASKEGNITFDNQKMFFIRLLSKLSKSEGIDNALEKLKKVYKGILDIDVLEIKSNALSNEAFLNVPLDEGIDYLVNEISCEDKNTKSTINLKRILELLDKLDNNIPLTDVEEYALKDTLEFLLNLYGYIYFLEYPSLEKNDEKIEPFINSINFKIVHAKNVWSEYIKKISKAIDCLIASNASTKRIDMWEERLRIYKLRLEKMFKGDNNILHLMRNSLTHGLVLHDGDIITFYGEEPIITLPKINSKTGELTEYTFQNKGRTFEINIEEDTYLSLLDSLYEGRGIEISVNISKYRKRKNYLKN